MQTILMVIGGLIGLMIILFITAVILNIFGISENDILELTTALQFLYRIFFPIAIIAYLYPKYKYRDLHYKDELTIIYLLVLVLFMISNNLVRWKYKRLYKHRKPRYNQLNYIEGRGIVGILLAIFMVSTMGIAVIIFFIKKYLL